MAAFVNVYVDQVSDYTLTLTVEDDSGNATDLTGYTVEAYFQKWGGANKVYKFTPTVTDAAAGKLQIKLLEPLKMQKWVKSRLETIRTEMWVFP